MMIKSEVDDIMNIVTTVPVNQEKISLKILNFNFNINKIYTISAVQETEQ